MSFKKQFCFIRSSTRIDNNVIKPIQIAIIFGSDDLKNIKTYNFYFKQEKPFPAEITKEVGCGYKKFNSLCSKHNPVKELHKLLMLNTNIFWIGSNLDFDLDFIQKLFQENNLKEPPSLKTSYYKCNMKQIDISHFVRYFEEHRLNTPVEKKRLLTTYTEIFGERQLYEQTWGNMMMQVSALLLNLKTREQIIYEDILYTYFREKEEFYRLKEKRTFAFLDCEFYRQFKAGSSFESIMQISLIITDNKLDIIDTYNHYLLPSNEVSSQVKKITRLNRRVIIRLGGNDDKYSVCQELFQKLKIYDELYWVGQGVKCDVLKLNQLFKEANLALPEVLKNDYIETHIIDTSIKRENNTVMSLANACDLFIEENNTLILEKEIFTVKSDLIEGTWHNSMFDACANYLCMKHIIKNKELVNPENKYNWHKF